MDRCSAPFFRALDALAVDDCRRRAGLAASVLTAEDVQRMVDAVERPIIVPAAEIVVHRAPRWQVLGQRAPLTAGREDIHHPVHHCPHIDLPLVAAALGGRDQRADDRPFFVGQIARIPQLAPVIPSPILLGEPRRESRRPDWLSPTRRWGWPQGRRSRLLRPLRAGYCRWARGAGGD